MSDTTFATLSTIIKNRRTIKPFMMNGHKIPDEQVQALFELADWAPTHGLTEPWRFVVYADPLEFCPKHAGLYRENTSAEEFNQGVYDNFLHQGDKVSHVIIAVMRRGDLPKIPKFEEEAATACAIQNILLGATALGIASFWSTGGMILKPAMKTFLNLRDEDEVMGVLYLGYTDEQPQGIRRVPLTDKVSWIS
ncbi:nitroreductase [Mucilaginibacter sp. UR6-11]|uniref:nitroreductase family protein n=1 Tax=Mucilaginibacter sp. UR6-11 TaxID=1435644 RepID=UPI001E64102C|nr:nitroreductase [Mucilaginibacter sp. UR6-11]MCC8423655.1 nitroreductase [Mucilaginibacter sp. UR6-11]